MTQHDVMCGCLDCAPEEWDALDERASAELKRDAEWLDVTAEVRQAWEKPNACPGCEGTGNLAVHGLDPYPCGMCNGTGILDPRTPSERDADEHDAETRATHESVRPQ